MRKPWCHLLPLAAFLSCAATVLVAMAGPTIDEYNRANPIDPRAGKVVPGSSVEDRKAEGCDTVRLPLKGDADQEHSPAGRESYAASVDRTLTVWDHRITDLHNYREPDHNHKQVASSLRLLSHLVEQGRADREELDRTRGSTWLDVKGRLEARFRRMDQEYRRVFAE